MAENVKNTKQRLDLETKITLEKQNQANLDNQAKLDADVKLEKGTTLKDIVESRRKTEDKLGKDQKDQVKFLEKQLKEIEKAKERGEKVDGRVVRGLKSQLKNKKEDLRTNNLAVGLERRRTGLLEKTTPIIENQASGMKDMADNLEGFIKKLPGGQFLSDALGITGLGDTLQEEVTEAMANHILKTGNSTNMLNVGFSKAKEIMGGVAKNAARLGKTLMRIMIANPILALVAAAVALFTIIRNVRSMQRKFANEVGISRDQVGALAIKTKAVAAGFNAIGLDGSKIQGTLKEIGSEFGSLENMTVANAANIERFAQNAGVSGTEVVKLNKLFMDLEGLSFDAATNVSKAAVDLAKAAGVSTAKVIGDMSSAAGEFAKFSTTGAQGMAKAAVEAAKVGASLTGILASVDNLISFEDSITKQFEAQVLTGRQINTEKARQLALDGDIAGLTSEIQSIVGGVGDIQSLNVIQRKSVADAIGISVGDLLKISRGEQVAQQETVQDKLTTTNKLLAAQAGDRKAILDATLDNKNINMNERAF